MLVPGRGSRRDIDGRGVVNMVMRLFVVVVTAMSVVMFMVMSAFMSVAKSAVLVVAVPVSASEEFEDEEHGTGRDQQAAHDQVFVTFDGVAELQADTDDDRAQDQRQRDVSQTHQAGQSQHPA